MQIRSRSLIGALALVLTVSLGLAGCGSSASSKDSAAKSTVADPAAPGPYGVGFRTIQIVDASRNRPLDVTVWYPTAPGTTGMLARYALLPTVYTDSKVAIADAPIVADEKLPMLIYSHGSGGLNFISAYITEHLASQGFIVIAANHTGNTAIDNFVNATVSQDQNDMNRPADITAEIDGMLARNGDAADPFHNKIDAERIGLFGHSYGGYTALATIGGHSTPLGSTVPDKRIKATIGLAPYTTRLTAAELAAVDVPTMMLVGTKDITTPANTNAEVAYDSISGRPLVLVEMTDAAHQSFTDVCAYLDEIPKLPDAPAAVVDVIRKQATEGCGAEFMPFARDIEVTNTMTTAFFLQYVAGKTGYDYYWTTWPESQKDLAVQSKLQ
jgi:predicted dienelactone hydrolase